jgi:hypothetical protein
MLGDLAAVVTIISGPIAVFGVFLVYRQLREIRADRRRDLERRGARAFPLIEILTVRLEADWGCDVVDNPEVPGEALLEHMRTTVESDKSLAGELVSACTELGAQETTLALMIETELKIAGYYFRHVVDSGCKQDQWEFRRPQLVKTMCRLRGLLSRLGAALPEEATRVGDVSVAEFRANTSEEIRRVSEGLAADVLSGSAEWPLALRPVKR